MPNLRVMMALGSIAHQTLVATLGLKQTAHKFRHGALHALSDGRLIADSYHCSRYNTNTGRLTPAMFEAVFVELRRLLDAA